MARARRARHGVLRLRRPQRKRPPVARAGRRSARAGARPRTPATQPRHGYGQRMTTTDFEHGISAIDTGFYRPRFDASHLIVEYGRAAFFDVGTNYSIPRLLDALREKGLGVDAVDRVILTHVHLDHAGGAGLLMQQLPNARAVLHPRGAPHMIDPGKLIAGATAVYGADEGHA